MSAKLGSINKNVEGIELKKHLVLYDSGCSLCRNSVEFLKSIDKEKKLHFAPLSGKQAEEALSKRYHSLLKENTIVLVEKAQKPRVWIRGRAVMRILWILGGKWRLIGWMYTVPFIDFFYKLVARHRHLF